MQASAIPLRENQLFLTETPGQAYRVISGRILVFVIPLNEDGSHGRHWFLCELMPGDTIPALSHVSPDTKGVLCKWVFGLSALEPGTLKPVEDTPELQMQFAAKAKLREHDQIGFAESIAEGYRLEAMREQRNLFATGEERRAADRRSLETIYDLFYGNRTLFRQIHELTGHPLYDACVRLCDVSGIASAAPDVLMSNCGRRFTVKDFARVSGFSCRDVVLEEDWFLNDSGPLLVFRSDDRSPMVCVPKKPGRYVLWDPETDAITPADETAAMALDPHAVMFYRPFPREKIPVGKLLLFALRDVQWRDVVAVLLFALLGTMVGLLTPLLNEKMFDLFIPLGNAPGLIGICAVILACGLGNISFTVVRNLASFRVLSRMKYSLRAAVLDRLFNLPQSFFRDYDSADLGQRAMGFSETFSQLSSTVVSAGVSAVFSAAYLWRMFDYGGSMSWFAVGLLLFVLLLTLLLGNRKLKLERLRVENESAATSMMFQFLHGISKLRIAGAENRALYQYLHHYTESRKMAMGKERCTLLVTILFGAVNICFSIVFFYIMISRNIDMSLGAFMGFTTAFSAFSAAMTDLADTVLEVIAAAPAFERVRPILETLPEKQDGLAMPGELTGEIEVSNVSFAYEENGPMILRDISFRIRPGEYIGIVGPSGCGKSTLLKLLLGFESPRSGRVYYDGCDIDTIDKRELRKRFGVVLQNGGLITGSIHDNITIAKPSATPDQVQKAVRAAGLEADIANMPMGLHTVLSEGDGSISGGQRQRVLIARAIVSNPNILFFDEATSALDNAAQKTVCESLEQLRATRVVIAHRLSTIVHCDRIFVMDAGKIVEEGSYEQLMEKKGLFYQLAARQMS